MRDMLPSLPIELWTLIARFAVERPWDPDRFLPLPIGDFFRIEGFAKSSTAFEEIVQMLKNEARVLSLYEFCQVNRDNANRDNASLKQVRHLEIYCEQDIIDFLNRMSSDFRPDIFDSLRCFPMVTHLSFAKPGPSLRILEKFSKIPMAQTLRYLEIRGQWHWLPGKLSPLCLPKLSHLSLSSKSSWDQDHVPCIGPEPVAAMASFLSGCRNLELFSWHVALYERTEWITSHEYDRETVYRNECAMTRLLADRLPKLVEVRWANLWARFREGESGQHATRIIREENSIFVTQDQSVTCFGPSEQE